MAQETLLRFPQYSRKEMITWPWVKAQERSRVNKKQSEWKWLQPFGWEHITTHYVLIQNIFLRSPHSNTPVLHEQSWTRCAYVTPLYTKGFLFIHLSCLYTPYQFSMSNREFIELEQSNSQLEESDWVESSRSSRENGGIWVLAPALPFVSDMLHKSAILSNLQFPHMPYRIVSIPLHSNAFLTHFTALLGESNERPTRTKLECLRHQPIKGTSMRIVMKWSYLGSGWYKM